MGKFNNIFGHCDFLEGIELEILLEDGKENRISCPY
jgi:hypothetical protein